MSSQRRRISRQDVERMYPLLALQQGMLYHDLASPDHQPYFRQVTFRIEGSLDPGLCERTWNQLMARHESLRSCFDYENTSQLLRLVWKQRSVEFIYRDLAAFSEAAQADALGEYRSRDRRRGFDLRRDPLIRVALFRVGDSQFEMIWSWPHIILDGWSGSVLFDEFSRIYSDLKLCRTPSLPPAPGCAAYLDRLAARGSAAARAYWARLLEGCDNIASIPKRTGGPNHPGYDPAEHEFLLSESQSGALREMAARNGVTIATALNSIWGVLLSLYNDTDDVVFGAVVSGRPPEVSGIERMVGLFLNTIPVRVRVSPGATFAGLLRDVQRNSIDSMRHDHLSLLDIQACLGAKRALFDHVLAFENYPEPAPDTGAEFTVTSCSTSDHTNYDFGLVIVPGVEFRLLFQYNRCAYTLRQMERLEAHVRALLHQVLRDDGILLDHLTLVTASESSVVMGPLLPYPHDATLVSLWETRVASAPESVAVIRDDRSWSYREVNERANQVAHALRSRLALQPEQPVGVLMERTQGRIIALLGILKAGGAYCPLSSASPEDRLRFLLDDSQCRAVIADAAGARRLNALRPGLALDLAECLTGPVHNPQPACRASNLAYLIYTSGSTGQPKGVLIEHGGFVNMILHQILAFGITPEDRVLQFASSSFDASLSEIFMALAAGAKLVFVGEETRRDGGLFQACMRKQRVTVATLPPSYLRALEQPEFPDLRVLITAGEPPDLEDARYYAARLRYFNAYGPTETSVCASFHEVRPEAAESRAIPIGGAVANSSIRLLDRRLRPIPHGVAGEICIGGPGLARGYLHNPELTARQFVRARSGGERLYRTGDMAYMADDGEIFYLGRADSQVKLRGIRVELGEIENALRACPGISQAAVALQAIPGRAAELTAYYVPGAPLDPELLRESLSRRLPPHMIPSAFVPVPVIPRTTAGKVNRQALAPPPDACAHTTAEAEAPRNDVERTIAAVWREVLGRDAIGIHDSFQDLGGDSLKAILVVGRLRRRGLALDLRELYRLGSIARLAAAVGECRPPSPAAAGPAPLTPIQRWFFDEHSPGNWPHFSHSILLRAAAAIEEAPLREAVAAVWLHHDALRTRYRLGEGAITQSPAPAEAAACFETLDLRQDPDAWGRLATYAASLRTGFSLEHGPLFRTVLCRMPDADHALMVAHHLVVDAVSWRILLQDISDAYGQALASRPVALPPKTSSYAEWSRALETWSRSKSLAREDAYWTAIESAPLDPIPTDFPAKPHHYGQTATLTVECPAPSGASDADLQAVLLTALARTLGAWAGCEHVRVLLAGHGRIPLGSDVDVSRTVGWFTARYPVLAFSGASDVASHLAATRRMLASVPSQGVGYGVLRRLVPGRSAPAPEPELALNYLGRLDDVPAGTFALSDRLPGASAGTLECTQKLEVDALLAGAHLLLSVRYSPALHRPETVMKICRGLREELALVWSAAASVPTAAWR